jgi:RNA polymerase sporulation-specific sigma factor
MKHAEVLDLIRQYKRERDDSNKAILKERLYEQFIPLIHSRISLRNITMQDRDEAVQEATIGFCKALEEFRFNKGTQFSTYLTLWIDHYVFKFLHSKNIIRIKRFDVAKRLFGEEGLDARMNKHLQWIDKDEKRWDVADKRESVESQIVKSDLVEKILEAAKELPEKQRYVFLSRNLADKSLIEIGREIGYTKQGVQVLEKRALCKIKQILKRV